MTVNFRGYLFSDLGTAVSDATVTLLDTGTSNTATTGGAANPDTTDSNGLWNFDNVNEGQYDVKVVYGSSVRYIRWNDQISLKEIDVRNNTGNTTPALTATNLINNVANQVAVFRGANTTRADGDIIYISYELANSAGEQTEFARMIVEAEDTHNGSEDGAIRFQVMRDGTLATVWEVKSTGDGDVDAPTMSFDLNMDSLSIGNGADTDIVLTFDANTADGVITWMEDEDYFKFSDEILMYSTEKILFGDTGTFIHQSADGVLTIESDTTVDINGAVALNGAITGATNITLSGELDAATLDISGNVDIDGTSNLSTTTVGELTTVGDSGSLTVHKQNDTVLGLNRHDGSGGAVNGPLLRFYGGMTEQGNISMTGATISYNAFTGSHYGITNESITTGMLVSMTGTNGRFGDRATAEILYGIAKTTAANDPNILGTYLMLVDPGESASTSNPHLVASVGNGPMLIVDKGANIAVGDYLVSSDIAGYAMKDLGTYTTGYVIGRATEAINWSTVSDTVGSTKYKLITVTYENFKNLEGRMTALETRVTALE